MASAAWGFSVSRSSGASCAAWRKSTSGLGTVSVPVLSMTSASTLRTCSRAVASRTSTFFCAAFPTATIRAVGVASPRAQGHAITSTETADSKASGSRSVPPTASHISKVSTAMPTTTGTKTRATRSTTRCTGALEPCACCTMRMICASMVCWPTCRAFMRRLPWLTTVPAHGRPAVSSPAPVRRLSWLRLHRRRLR